MSRTYLLASLPMLHFEESCPLTLEEFLTLCAEQLSGGELSEIQALLEQRGGKHPFHRAWRSRENLLRNAVARERVRRRKTGASDTWQRPADEVDLALAAGVASAFQAEHPLARERALDRLRWSGLDELTGFDPLGFTALLAYALKLKLKTRWQQLDQDEGRARFEGLIGEVKL